MKVKRFEDCNHRSPIETMYSVHLDKKNSPYMQLIACMYTMKITFEYCSFMNCRGEKVDKIPFCTTQFQWTYHIVMKNRNVM